MVDRPELLSHARARFGSSCELETVEKFVGGVRKQTFRVQLRNPSVRFLFAVWDREKSYFPERETAGFEGSHSDVNAPHAFHAHTEYLLGVGINVPQILHFDRLESGHYFAFVELIEGSDYGTFGLAASSGEKQLVLNNLSGQVRRLHSEVRSYPGGVFEDYSADRLSPQDESCDVALVEIEAAAESEPWVAQHQEAIAEKLAGLRAAIEPRHEFRLLHGELDPGHILVRGDDLRVYLVDIEGLGFSDLEGEHAFLKWRFSEEDYRYLARDDLDQDRLDYYKFRMHISHVYAGSRLLLHEHPAKEFSQQILSGNLAELRRLMERG
jgi:aminoglycoside phosphotransferase (APT) family kinase protein